MTALAMIIGMVPMSLGLGEGGEQNAPLGRRVADCDRRNAVFCSSNLFHHPSPQARKRSVDVGDLVTAGVNATMNEGNELFRLARTDVLRVFINVPQIYSPVVSQGTKAYLQLMEFPGEKFQGHITNISGAIDPTTRTLLTEVQVPNPDGRLFPGAYGRRDRSRRSPGRQSL